MSSKDEAGQARKGLIDSVKGKAKEFAGAVTGNDSLTTEGQLEQAQARQRKEASTADAVAKAEAEAAQRQAADATVEASQQRRAADTRAAEVSKSAEQQASAAKHAADRDAERDAERAKMQAEVAANRKVEHAHADERQEVREAAEDLTDAAAKRDTSRQVAANTEAEAQRLKAQADKLADDADLP